MLMNVMKYSSIILKFFWVDTDFSDQDKPIIAIQWKYISEVGGGVIEENYNRTMAQVEQSYLPLLRIVKGFDHVNMALLYVTDDSIRSVFLRIIETGKADFITVKGITVNENGKWYING